MPTDFEEVKTIGKKISATRTAYQTQTAQNVRGGHYQHERLRHVEQRGTRPPWRATCR